VADGTAKDPVQQPGQGLKALVIGLGVLLALCAAIVIGTIVYRLFNMPAEEGGDVADKAGFGIAQLPVPPGCAIIETSAAGDRLIIQIGGSDACRRVLVADLKTGALIGEFHFTSE
jgi:hypothetical protein